MGHQLRYTTIVSASAPLGESTFAAARTELEARYGVTPAEVFLDGIQVEGTIPAGDLTIDLAALHLRVLTFGADAPAEQPPAEAQPVTNLDPLHDLLDEPDEHEGSADA